MSTKEDRGDRSPQPSTYGGSERSNVPFEALTGTAKTAGVTIFGGRFGHRPWEARPTRSIATGAVGPDAARRTGSPSSSIDRASALMTPTVTVGPPSIHYLLEQTLPAQSIPFPRCNSRMYRVIASTSSWLASTWGGMSPKRQWWALTPRRTASTNATS